MRARERDAGKKVLKVLSISANIKHRAILLLIYAAGLWVGEAVRLKIEDIDSKRQSTHNADMNKLDEIVHGKP